MEIVLSGIRSTGKLHLGNYFGALTNFVKLQDMYPCYFFIADYHSLTTHPTPENFEQNVRQVLAEYIACGIDPEKSTLYIQSDVPEVCELYLLLNMNAYVGELERCTSFKEKIRKHPDNINGGLLTYPVLMAADILLHKSTKVPVGKDQEQHLEMARTFAGRFNRMYKCSCFPEPQAFNFGDKLVKIPGLDGSTKMGKSEGSDNALYLHESPEITRKKIMKAVTDSGPIQENQGKPQSVQNLFDIMKVVSKPETLVYFEEEYNKCRIRYGDLKKQLAEDVLIFINPISQRITELLNHKEYLDKMADLGAEKARESARKTIQEVREIIGFRKIQ
ncbi:MAG: tryptophan--tRNA ligase [Bacteroidales bacterium]|nr:tryptophan--tRNA ligase [Bacteroidales bacterium]